ncbi:MAG: glycosyltransferase [Methanosarcina sp.]|nr:glycosyltransferase [Methanosarcina sp.]
MKVLFVSSGNSKNKISPIIKAQGTSLESMTLQIDYFAINGRGIRGYLSNVSRLRSELRKQNYDLVHAHFSFSGFVASLAGARPLVVSLMGWNVQKPILKRLICLFNRFTWDACIVKSQKMRESLNMKGLYLIPNGVDLCKFYVIDRYESQVHLGWDPGKTHFLCAADPKRPIKNVDLARAAYDLIKTDATELHFLGDVPFEEVVYHYNASDVVYLTSNAEGSPNVIKEALACNCKIVSTDVGDVAERFDGNSACFIAKHDASDIAEKLQMAMDYKKNVDTRKLVLGLDSRRIAEMITGIYNSVVKKG